MLAIPHVIPYGGGDNEKDPLLHLQNILPLYPVFMGAPHTYPSCNRPVPAYSYAHLLLQISGCGATPLRNHQTV
jgi:hypothetical protein